MSDRVNHFELKLLTSSKEIGLRRLRSYAAALGGTASIFHSYDELFMHLNASAEASATTRPVVLHDHTLKLSADQIMALRKVARVFLIQTPKGDESLPPATSPCWHTESYFRCSISAMLDSPVVRMSMAQMLKLDQRFQVEQLLRWGHAASTWNQSDPDSLADHGIRFIRNLALTGESRRLAEMFNHFLQTRLNTLNLTKNRVVFGSDGLLLSIIVHCDLPSRLDLRGIVEELRVHEFPIALVNEQSASKTLEIAGLFYPHIAPEIALERIIMVFRKEFDENARADASTFEKAG